MASLCFKEKSTLLRCLVFLVTVLIMILVALAIILINRNEDNKICKNDQCYALSAQLIRYIDQSIDPCQDFYSFICGNFIKNRGEFELIEPEMALKNSLRELVQMNDTKPFIQQKMFYATCSNLAGLELDDDETILELFYAIGDWPVLRGAHWVGTYFDWTDVAQKSRKLGLKIDWFLEFSIYPDVNGTGRNLLKIDIPKLKPFEKWELVPRTKLFTKVAVALGAPQNLAHYETGRTIDFEHSVLTLAQDYRMRKKNQYSVNPPKTTIDEIQKLWPRIQWLDFINNMTGVRLVGTDLVIFDEVVHYIEDLTQIIVGTPKRIVADYMMWKIVEEWWPFLSQQVRQIFEEFFKTNYQKYPISDRQTFCISESRKQFPLIAECEYIHKHVTQDKRLSIKELIFIIRDKYIELVRKANWLSKELRQTALRSLEQMDFWIGGPKGVFDIFGFAEDLGVYGFVYRSSNVVDMLTQRQLHHYNNYFKMINKLVTNRTQTFYEKVVNISSFTVINGNTLVIPAGVLRDVFYNTDLPNYFNYASFGKILAKEIFEFLFGFKNNTEIFSSNSAWAKDPFESVVQCLTKDTSFMHNTELRHPKKLRQLLSDFVAPEIAYESYKDWSLVHNPEKKLPSLNYTPKQLFWIQTTKSSCRKIYSKQDRDTTRFKIIAPLKNSESFIRDFNCSTDYTRTYSKSPCRIL